MAEGVLDAGDDTILLQEDRFKQFMKGVESMVEDAPVGEVLEEEEETSTLPREEEIYQERPVEHDQRSGTTSRGEQLALFETDQDVPEVDPKNTVKEAASAPSPQAPEWLQQLSQVLADPQQTQAVVKSFTEKDTQTGQTFLKLPVENEQVVENMLQSLGQLFQAVDWGKLGK